MISATQQNYINMSLELAAKSTYRFRLGAVITAGGRVKGTGFSKYRNTPSNMAEAHVKQCSEHAELAALRECLNGNFFNKSPLKRATIFVGRLDKANKPALAKPCYRCTKVLLDHGISKFIWSIDQERCVISKIDTLMIY